MDNAGTLAQLSQGVTACSRLAGRACSTSAPALGIYPKILTV